jgi:Tfp pilus assembly protein PilF
VRERKSDTGLAELRQAAELEPAQARYAYVYAIGLSSAGHLDDALVVLRESLRRHPNDREALSAAIAFSRQKGHPVAALEYAVQLARLFPDAPALSRLIEDLRHRK